MLHYVGGKLVHLALVLLLVSFATYALLDLMPGSVEFSIFGPEHRERPVGGRERGGGIERAGQVGGEDPDLAHGPILGPLSTAFKRPARGAALEAPRPRAGLRPRRLFGLPGP